MKLGTCNRQGDKHPILTLKAENQAEGKQLKRLLKKFKKVQGVGFEHGMSGNGYPPCGCLVHHHEIDSIAVRVLLG